MRKRSASRSPMKSKSPMKSASPKKSKVSSKSPSKQVSPMKKQAAGERQLDMLDKLVQKVGIPGLMAVVVAIFAGGVAVEGVPTTSEIGLPLCALAMGMGKGGAPGFSTLASAFFALLAPPGQMNAFLAIAVPVTFMSDLLVGLTYFRDAKWDVAAKLLLWTGMGIVVGAQINSLLSDEIVRRSIGVIFMLVVAQLVYDMSKTKNEKQMKAKIEFMQSLKVVAPVGLIGGIASYITNNMGPMLNVYLVALSLDKYALVGTRSAIFSSVNIVKLCMRFHAGDLPMESLERGVKLGCIGCAGVLMAKVWLMLASKEFFDFVYKNVTLTVVSLTGALLVCGWDMKGLVRFLADQVAVLMGPVAAAV